MAQYDDGFGDDTVWEIDLADEVLGYNGGDYIVELSALQLAVSTGLATPSSAITHAFNAALIPGGPGNDTLVGGDGHDVIYGEGGNDLIYGGKGNDTLYGGDGADTLHGQSGRNTFYGGAGNDTIHFEAGDVIDGGDGVDTVVKAGGINLNQSTFIDIEILKLSSHSSASVWLYGSFATIDAEPGTILILTDGGALDLSTRITNRVDVYASAYGNAVTGGAGNDTFNGSIANDTLSGGVGNDKLHGGLGDDLLVGGDGNDQLRGEEGNDSIFGGLGNDFIEISNGSDFIDGGDGINNLYGVGNIDALTIVNVQNLDVRTSSIGSVSKFSLFVSIFTLPQYGSLTYLGLTDGGALDLTARTQNSVYVTASNLGNTVTAGGWNDTLNGGNSADVLNGGWGDDSLSGGFGSDSLMGGAGADTLVGGYGNDSYYVDNIGDTVIEAKKQGTDSVFSSVSFSVATVHVENLTLTGTDAINATGNALNNILVSNKGTNVLTGGLGDDTYFVHNNADTVVEVKKEGTDTVNAWVSFSIATTHVENLKLLGTGHVHATGNAYDNIITGNTGNNFLTGGLGADIFVFGLNNAKDIITDFSAAQNDAIDISAYTMGLANAGMVTQTGLNVLIDLGGGNTVVVNNATQADVLGHIIW